MAESGSRSPPVSPRCGGDVSCPDRGVEFLAGLLGRRVVLHPVEQVAVSLSVPVRTARWQPRLISVISEPM